MASQTSYEWVQEKWYEARGWMRLTQSGIFLLTLVGVFGVIGFLFSAITLSLTLDNREDVRDLEYFADNILANYLTQKCVNCLPTEALAYNLNISNVTPDPVIMWLRGEARQEDQFVTGFTTPCGQCTTGSIGYDWQGVVSDITLSGIYSIRSSLYGFLRGLPYAISEYGVTYDPLGIWSKAIGITIAQTPADKHRCEDKTANSMYVVAVSSDVVQDVCCKYVICFCTQPGPREFCTRSLLSASNSLDADRLNCLYGNNTGGCGCGSEVC